MWFLNSSRSEKTSCFTAVINHTRPTAQKKSRQNLRFGGCQSSPPPCRLYALLSKIYLKNWEKPCSSGPLVKIIILPSASKASSLTTSLKSINENVCRVFRFLPLLMSSLLTKIGISMLNFCRKRRSIQWCPDQTDWLANWSLRYAQKCSKSGAKNSDQNFLPLHLAAPW